MSCEVYANNNEISCKGGDNKVIAEFPDVCLTPPSPPAGPIPVPYPDTSFSKDMKEGSKTVQIKGKEVMLKDKSYYKTSPLGDEAATNGLGANVLTHTITGKTYCVAWSMDVKIEGENVDRHMDMTTSNHMCAPQPGGTPPANLTIGAMKPVIPGQKYTDQTCTDAERDALHKDIDKKCKKDMSKVPLRQDIASYATDAAAKKRVCAGLRKKEQQYFLCLAARQKMQDDCFSSPKTTPAEQAEHKAHVDHYKKTFDEGCVGNIYNIVLIGC